MPLLEHLRELRKRVIRSALFIVIFSVVGWMQYNTIITTLSSPVCDLRAAQESGSASCGALYISGVLGPLNLQLKVSFLTGVILSAPFWLYQIWAFIAPALHRKEKRNSILFIIAATPFFALGATLAYIVLPLAIEVLFGFTPESLNNLIRFDDYLDFVLRLILIFGIAFELPVFLVSQFGRNSLGEINPAPLAFCDFRHHVLCGGFLAHSRSAIHGSARSTFDSPLLRIRRNRSAR